MVHYLPITKARINLGQVVRRVVRNKEYFILEKDGIPGYIAHPEGPGRRPGVLMVHHAHGVTADYKIDAYRLAQLGFNVFAPSLLAPQSCFIGMAHTCTPSA